MVIPSVVDVSPSSLPWFVYSNLLQNVSRSFINSSAPCNMAVSCTLYVQTYVLATRRKSTCLTGACHGLKQYTKHLSCTPYLVQINKFSR